MCHHLLLLLFLKLLFQLCLNLFLICLLKINRLYHKLLKFSKKILEAYDIVYLFLSEILGLEKEEAKQQAEQIKASMSDSTLNSLAKYVHSEWKSGDLNCHYDLNREKCRICATLKKENANMKKNK